MVAVVGAASMALASASLAQQSSYYRITSANAILLSNAVRLTVRADGAIRATANLADYYSGDDLEQGFESVSYPPVDRIKLTLNGARSGLGSFVPVNQYPVSHIEFSIPPGSPQTYKLDMEVVLFRRSRMRMFDLEGVSTGDVLWEHDDPNWFEVSIGPDKRSIIITVSSDRQPVVSERRSATSGGTQTGGLAVWTDDGKVGLSSSGALLTDVVRALSDESRTSILLDSGVERVVTAHLPPQPLTELVERICQCYGLGSRAEGASIALSDITKGTSASFPAAQSRKVPLKWLKPRAARDLLPSCLLPFIRIDDENNSLLVHGPASLADRVAADMKRLDNAPDVVSVEAVILESGSSRSLLRNLRTDIRYGGVRLATAPETGDIFFGLAPDLPSDSIARLRALADSSSAEVKARSTLVATSGRSAEFFSGRSTYIQVQRLSGIEVAIPVNAGVEMKLTPTSGGGVVTMKIEVEVGNVAARDAVTGMPSIDTRSVTGVLRARPGQTLVVGGLRQDSQETLRRRVPILGYLPVIGQFFRYKSRASEVSETTILLTPKVIRGTDELALTGTGSDALRRS